MIRRPPRSTLFPTRRSSDLSSSASSIPLNLGVGCAPSCWPIFGFRNLLGARRGAEGSFLCSLSSRFSGRGARSEEHTSELQSRLHLVCRLLLEKKKKSNTEPKTRKLKTKTAPAASTAIH